MARRTKRRGHSDDAIYWDENKGRWYGSVSLGFDRNGKRLRRKVSGKTKTEIKEKDRSKPLLSALVRQSGRAVT
jgi:hypothetical protein